MCFKFHCGKLELINVSLTTIFTLPDRVAAALERTTRNCSHPGRGEKNKTPPWCRRLPTSSQPATLLVFLSGFFCTDFRACHIRSLCYMEHKPPWVVRWKFSKTRQKKKHIQKTSPKYTGEIFVSRLQILQFYTVLSSTSLAVCWFHPLQLEGSTSATWFLSFLSS